MVPGVVAPVVAPVVALVVAGVVALGVSTDSVLVGLTDAEYEPRVDAPLGQTMTVEVEKVCVRVQGQSVTVSVVGSVTV